VFEPVRVIGVKPIRIMKRRLLKKSPYPKKPQPLPLKLVLLKPRPLLLVEKKPTILPITSRTKNRKSKLLQCSP
jgi:hypothetical protein